MKTPANALPASLVLLSVGVMVWMALLATSRALTSTEAVLLQFISVTSSFAGSYLIARDNAFPKQIRLSARSAFRRLVSLYEGLSRIGQIMDTGDDEASKLARIEEVTIVHLLTSDDALQDWSDLDPEGVKELKKSIERRKRSKS